MEQRKYMDVVRLGHKTTQGVLNEGDYIVVMEKLDGANASFRLGPDGSVVAFSRNTQLNEENNLRGFYQWVKQNIDPRLLQPDVIYFGEWLVKHKLDYGDNGGQQFYLFDVFFEPTSTYAFADLVLFIARDLKLQTAPIFYAGPYKGFDHLMSFVGKSALGEQGEGIVVKNYDYRDPYGKQIFVKLVSEKFAEMQPQKKPRDPNQPEGQEAQFIKTFMTRARVEKLLLKLVDEGILDEQFGIEDMGTILRNLGTRVYDDILKEETPPQDFDEKAARKAIGKHLPLMVKEIINDRN
jgi:RNA ligase.